MIFLGLTLALLATYVNAQTQCTNPYVVQPGNTYCVLAQVCGCPSWQTLQNANTNYPYYNIPVGVSLTIPSTCTGTPLCKNVPINSGDTYQSIAAYYGVDVNCLMNTNCNGTLYAGSQICIPTGCPVAANTTTVPTTTVVVTNPPVAQNGWINGNFYCNNVVNNAAASSATLINCGGVMYSNGQPVNGWNGQYFYCNGVQTTVVTQTCGGLYYVNGSPLTGNNAGSFYCNGINFGPSTGTYNCAGTTYVNSSPANGWINSQFYCNGQLQQIPSSSMESCGGTIYQNGMTYTGLYGGIYYQNGKILYDCTQGPAFVASGTLCSTLTWKNPNGSAVTQAQLQACNPGVSFTTAQGVCQVPAGWIAY
jgi:LysM repeat protein